MKPTIRIVAVTAIVIVVALGAWNGVMAQKGPATAGSGSSWRSLLAPFFQPGSNNMNPEVESVEADKSTQLNEDHSVQEPEASETAQVMDDHPGQHVDDNTPEPAETPEPNDNQAQGEITGTITAISGNSVTIDGQTFQLATGAEGVAGVRIGDVVKIEFVTNSDGTVSVREVKAADQSGSAGDSNHAGNDSSGHDSGGSGSGSDGGDDGGGSGHGGSGGG